MIRQTTPRPYTFRPNEAERRSVDDIVALLHRMGAQDATRNDAMRFALASTLSQASTTNTHNEPALSVPLHGQRGGGQHFLIDQSVWESGLASGWPAEFTLMYQPNGKKVYVVTTRLPISADRRPVPLARLIMGAKRGERVAYSNGDPLDLRKCNLVKLTKAQFAAMMLDTRRRSSTDKTPSSKSTKTPRLSAA